MQYRGDNLMSVKRTNRSAALWILHRHGAMSRKRLAENMGLTPAAITKIVGEMISEGLLSEGEMLQTGGAGRREILINLNPEAGIALGVLINLRQVLLSAVRLDGQVLFSEEIAIKPHADADTLIPDVGRRLMAAAEQNRITREKIIGLGIAVRGICSADGELVVNSFGALLQENVPLRARLAEITGLPCVMANNVRALFAAEMFFSKEDAGGSQFFLRCEYGIGAALSIGGEIWHGVTEQCAEIGHIPVVRRGGKPCSCGKSGCLETIASPGAIREDALNALSPTGTPILWKISERKGADRLLLSDIFTAAQNGDAVIAGIVDRAAEALAYALKCVIYLVDPGKIVLYGRMFEEPYYLSRLMAEMQEGVDSGHSVEVEKSAWNQQLEKKAAGLVAVEEYFNQGGIH